MSDYLQHITPGQPWPFHAAMHNATVDTIRAVRESRNLFRPGELLPSTDPELPFTVLNLSSEEIPQWGCVELVNITGEDRIVPDKAYVGEPDDPVYFGAVKPYAPGGSQRECSGRLFAFADVAIPTGEKGKVRMARAKPVHCLLAARPRLKRIGSLTAFDDELGPIPGSFKLGCGSGFRFAGLYEDEHGEGWVVADSDTVTPHCIWCDTAVCIEATIPALTCTGGSPAGAPGGTFSMTCCVDGDDDCSECSHYADAQDSENRLDLYVTRDANSCNCVALLQYAYYDSGAMSPDWYMAWWQAELGWQDDGFTCLDNATWSYVGQSAGSTFTGGSFTPCPEDPDDITVTVNTTVADCDGNCAADDETTPCDETCVAVSKSVVLNDGCKRWQWDTGTWGGPCADPTMHYAQNGCPTGAGQTSTIDCCSVDCNALNDTVVDTDCKDDPDCPDTTPPSCLCTDIGNQTNCLWELAAVAVTGGPSAKVWVQLQGCTNLRTNPDPATFCSQDCTCDDPYTDFDPSDYAVGDQVFTDCGCPDAECQSEEGACCNVDTCTFGTHDDCDNLGGLWQGPGTDCDPNPCA